MDQVMGLGEEGIRQSGTTQAVGGALWPAIAAAVTSRWLSTGAMGGARDGETDHGGLSLNGQFKLSISHPIDPKP